MNQIKNILVGVDLAAGDRLVSDELAPSTIEGIERALWLAKLNAARLHFFFSLDISARAQQSIQEDRDAESTVLDEANRVLGRLVDRAKEQGIDAVPVVTFGKSWLELVRHVLREQCDLVIIGGRQHGTLEQLFIGSTGMNLLRNCPCPVWVTHLPRKESDGAILVAHDLTAVGARVLELGAKLAEIYQAPLHVVHVIEAFHVNTDEPLAMPARAEKNAHQTAKEKIVDQLKPFKLAQPAKIEIVEGSPNMVMQEKIEQHDIDLLVMGTLARAGVEGLLIGNTAERLLPQIPCSVLAVKPADFRTPVTIE